ncbi:MAG: deoxyribodipyrimidine photo-lyase [Phycisphaerales bacterium]|jgi:deoxyribodipyrimidine photo-lyase
MAKRGLMWFRSDLRVADNPALYHACANSDRGTVAVFLICPEQWVLHDCADIRIAFLRRTLQGLRQDLEKLRIPLLIRDVQSFQMAPRELLEIARDCKCDQLCYNREYEANEVARDEEVEIAFSGSGVKINSFTDQVILPPGSLRTATGRYYSVFTPFRKAWLKSISMDGLPEMTPSPKKLPEMVQESESVPVCIRGFDSTADKPELWPSGEREAQQRLQTFVSHGLMEYKTVRDLPFESGTSTLSPYLAVGAISTRQCIHAAVNAADGQLESGEDGPDTWISELVWREFYRHVLVGFSRVSCNQAFRRDTESIRWRNDESGFDAWCNGQTGFPIVDAAMRQLLATGWMHNRLRMITAMFLAKDLLIDWRRGERFFMRHLIDGDLASNNGGWQWAASTGTDAAPYFRIFNPTTQSRRFDPAGNFIRKWVPELRGLSSKEIHAPFERVDAELDQGYPRPIVDHAMARNRTIDLFKSR